MICSQAESATIVVGFKADGYAQITARPSLPARKLHRRHPFCSAYPDPSIM